MVLKRYKQPEFYHFTEDSIELSRFIERGWKISKNRNYTVVEFGAGSGIVSCELFKNLNVDQSNIVLHLVEKEREFEKSLLYNIEHFCPLKKTKIHIKNILDLSNKARKYGLLD